MIRCNLNRDLWQARQLSITVCHFPTETFCVCAVLKDDITHTRRDTNFIADNISAAGQHLKRELRHPSLGDNNAKLHQLIPDKPFHRVADDYIQTERGRMSNWHETRSRCDAWKHHTSDGISSLASIFHKNRLGDIKHAIFAHTHSDTHTHTHHCSAGFNYERTCWIITIDWMEAKWDANKCAAMHFEAFCHAIIV